ncbi:MAG: hypothetical protein Q8N47_16745, partial [Bryobacterales bacterium]|nr:hypothetical protein [Bryobacterales bacterium]
MVWARLWTYYYWYGWMYNDSWYYAAQGTPNRPPTADTFTPNGSAGNSAKFTFVYSDPDGYGNLSNVQFLVGSSLSWSPSYACWISFYPGTNALYLSTDSGGGVIGPAYLNGTGTLENSQCSVNSGGSWVEQQGSTTLKLNVDLKFKQQSFSGAKYVFMFAQDAQGSQSGWIYRGSWTVPGWTPPLSPGTRLEMNVGPVPFDYYSYSNLNCQPGHGDCAWNPEARFIPSCSSNTSVRQCYRNVMSGYQSQGVTGARFQYALCGGGYSTALRNCGLAPQQQFPNPFVPNASIYFDSAWRTKIDAFFEDLYAFGLYEITPSSEMQGWDNSECIRIGVCQPYAPNQEGGFVKGTFSGPPETNLNTCEAVTTVLRFYPTLPFGWLFHEDQSDPNDDRGPGPYLNGLNNSFNCAPPNPIFVGWQNIYTVVSNVVASARQHNLAFTEMDMQNEVDMVNFTVYERLLADNRHLNSQGMFENVLVNYWNIMYYYNDMMRVTHSAQGSGQSSKPDFDCPSVYGVS